MAYFNWGEQVANSFVTMMANNQQKRLEQQRLGMEQQRLQDTMQTNALQRSAYEQEMKQREYEMKKAKDEDLFWAGLGNTNVAIRDRNSDGTINASDYEAMPFKRAMEIHPMAYGQFDVNSWDNKTNTFMPTQVWYRNSDASTLLDNALNTGTQQFSVFKQKQDYAANMAQIRASEANAAATRYAADRQFEAQQNLLKQTTYGEYVDKAQEMVNSMKDAKTALFDVTNMKNPSAEGFLAAELLSKRYGVSRSDAFDLLRSLYNLNASGTSTNGYIPAKEIK